jgi:hypothetical protein
MKIERFAGHHEARAGHHEAREALLLASAGVTVLMLIESFILMILY